MIEEHEILAVDTYWDSVYGIDVDLNYIIPKTEGIPAPSTLEAVNIKTDKPVNNKNFSLSGMGEGGTIDFTSVEVFDPDASNADRSNASLQILLNELDASSVSGSGDEADRIRNLFGQDSNNNYVVRTVLEQKRWVRDFIHNSGVGAEWRLFGGSYDFRTVDEFINNTGTPIFINQADIERRENTRARGRGQIRFELGGRVG